MSKNDGGPSFPCEGPWYYEDSPGGQRARCSDVHLGMSLRDWFAGMAMLGILASKEAFDNPDKAAQWSYGFSDAMLRAREEVR